MISSISLQDIAVQNEISTSNFNCKYFHNRNIIPEEWHYYSIKKIT